MYYKPIRDESKTYRDEETGYFITPQVPCPFGVRDLSKDECYSGNGQNKCKYFVRYDWDEHPGCVACTHPPIKKEIQLEFDFS